MIEASSGYKVFSVLNIVFFICLSIIMLFPFINVLCLSLEPNYIAIEPGAIHLIPREITFKAYREIWTTGQIATSFLNSIYITVIGAAGGVIVTSMLGYAISNENILGTRLISYIIFFTMVFSGGIIPSYLLVKNLGMLDSLWALIVPSLISGYNVILARTFFNSIPSSLPESAMIDGCNEISVFFRIILPLSKPIIATLTLFYAVSKWNSFFDGVMYIVSNDKKPLMVILREIIVESATTEAVGDDLDIGENVKMATVIVTIVPILCVYPFLQKHFTKGIMLGAVKG